MAKRREATKYGIKALRKRHVYLVETAILGVQMTMTLREYCYYAKINYNTICARIWRTEPKIAKGALSFKDTDSILQKEWDRGNPRDKKPPKRQAQNQITKKHLVTNHDGISRPVRSRKKIRKAA